jgi:hypothetical protein
MSDASPTLEETAAPVRRERPETRTLRQCLRVFGRHGSPAVISTLIAVTLAWRALLGAFEARELLAFAAVAAWWPLQEWAAHRWILHLRPFTLGRLRIDPYFARRHRQHHAHPNRFRDVFLPARVVLGAWFVFAALLVPLLGQRAGVTALLAISCAALLYEWVHFSAHADRVPSTAWGRRVVKNHRLHHFLNEQHFFAFTVPQLDDWFDTGGDPSSVPRSATVRSLGVEP